MTTTRPVRRTIVTTLLAAALAVTATGCGSEESDVDPALQSSADTEMKVVDHDGGQYAVGHGIALEMPEEWTDYEPEKVGSDGTTYEWAVGMPAETRPLPFGIQFSMGMKGKGAPFETLPTATKELAELAPGYKLVDEGDADVPGAEDAAFVRFEKELDLGDGPVTVEQLQLILDMPAGEVSVLRFIGEAGKWDEQLGSAYDSLVVTEGAEA
jgi:hypothetical protein